jgi:hypothetical protein
MRFLIFVKAAKNSEAGVMSTTSCPTHGRNPVLNGFWIGVYA